ncbi:MAG: hypothetical protein IPJ77_04135 [Planctomycetes bacterium]|nr:hypothetical protein [Planctomycetota bacterium]
MTHARSPLVVLVAALALSSVSSAQQFPTCPIPGRVGPDVIVGDVNGVQNYAAVGALEALSLGTTSCNVGTQSLNWFANTTNHPVIGGNLFRYKVVGGAGRFEQLGQSWVKHAFLALSENLCCATCVGDPMGTHLGVGCSDPYTASRNGTQSMLGPRYQVNAHTGAFVAAPPHPSGGNNGRIQVGVAELEPTGGASTTRFFGQAIYVAPDDAAANNNDDNSSWRELSASVASGAWTFGTIGATQRRQAALDAWKVAEPAVTTRAIDVPEGTSAPYDGTARVILGWRVTDLGGGTWRYEYALENVNSDRAMQAVSVPLGAGVTVSNAGFHDVDYLAGDGLSGVNQAGTDWATTVTASSIAWSTQTFAQNGNANALRWGTTYNYRFDANVAPVSGSVTLTQFKVANAVAVTGVDVPGVATAPPGLVFCSGDGTVPGLALCPCANTGASGRGCANSANALGARLAATGIVANDTLVLQASGMPATVSAIFLKGDQANASGVVFGDGVRCVDGALVRLGTVQNVGGASQYPSGVQASVSVRGGTPIGSGLTGHYQTYYRNSSAAFCPPETFNVSNGLAITW